MNSPDHDAYADDILEEALGILYRRLQEPGAVITNYAVLHQYIVSEYALLENEQFGCMFLDNAYRLINHKKLFRGTINQCATYPREIVREALLQNAVFVILIHNHPSMNPTPSKEDINMTSKLKEVLTVVDIALFDHIIVAGSNLFSMREEGLLV